MKWIVVYEDVLVEYSGTLEIEEFDNEELAIIFWNELFDSSTRFPKYLAKVYKNKLIPLEKHNCWLRYGKNRFKVNRIKDERSQPSATTGSQGY